ncbi:MAG: sigma-70 family RNA polymerase sigma factor [Candidatus Paceibacterota bacterium]
MTQTEFTHLYDEYADSIYRYGFFRLSQDKALAEDLVQETFTKTWTAISKGTQITNGKTFLFTVAHNLIIDIYRKKKTASLDQMTAFGFNPENTEDMGPEKKAEIAEILKYINRLPDNYKQVLILRFVENLGPKEIADIIGESENNVSVRINRGLAKLREIMNLPTI